ncbi:uncharacterized protein LOC143259649 isoform X3 [Megalopta genalis]|uniref:uncharacterized protein LOC143259649 isoform X3 n=1 Tax=Megalopta genalis TaxID=115081 RepID=UPI003FD64264
MAEQEKHSTELVSRSISDQNLKPGKSQDKALPDPFDCVPDCVSSDIQDDPTLVTFKNSRLPGCEKRCKYGDKLARTTPKKQKENGSRSLECNN